MGWMKAIYTDVAELNETMLDLYSENEITSPDDAIDPLSEYLAETGWKTPTEMLALRRNIIADMQAVTTAPDEDSSTEARGQMLLNIMDAFGISFTDLTPAQVMA